MQLLIPIGQTPNCVGLKYFRKERCSDALLGGMLEDFTISTRKYMRKRRERGKDIDTFHSFANSITLGRLHSFIYTCIVCHIELSVAVLLECFGHLLFERMGSIYTRKIDHMCYD